MKKNATTKQTTQTLKGLNDRTDAAVGVLSFDILDKYECDGGEAYANGAAHAEQIGDDVEQQVLQEEAEEEIARLHDGHFARLLVPQRAHHQHLADDARDRCAECARGLYGRLGVGIDQ